MRLGASSRDTTAVGVLVLDEDAVTEQCERICPVIHEVREMDPPMLADTAEEQDEDLERICVNLSDLRPAVHEYKTPESYSSPVTDAVLDVLSEEEMCRCGRRGRRVRKRSEIL